MMFCLNYHVTKLIRAWARVVVCVLILHGALRRITAGSGSRRLSIVPSIGPVWAKLKILSMGTDEVSLM